jgi:26S proteasome regulatory subunit, ATPase 3, interacting protein
VNQALKYLEPLRAGIPLISAAELAAMDADWAKWKTEWAARHKIFTK